MARLTPEEKAARAFARMLGKAKQYRPSKYVQKYVAPVFQRMIRAEVAAEPEGIVPAVVDGEIVPILRYVGQCVCVTCGRVGLWSEGLEGMHTGHFIPSRRHSILFQEDNVAPQCSHCNCYQGGRQGEFRIWMEYVRGTETIDRLKFLENEIRQFSHEELVAMLIEYRARLKAAEKRMEEHE